MHTRLWLFAVAAACVLLGSATASAGQAKVAGPEATPAAAPFAQAWAQVPRTPAARAAKNVLVFGAEQDITGFNTSLNCCAAVWAAWQGFNEAVHGAFNINSKGAPFMDLVSAASATQTGLSYTIRPDAFWYWGGKKLPLTYKDFVYTWQQFTNPANDVATRAGYNQIAGYTHKGTKQITFTWKKCGPGGSTPDNPCGPYAYWQILFAGVYPAAALQGENFNTIWSNCICGFDGKPVSNGPFYVSNYTKGQGTTLKVNPYWYGKKPGLQEVDFKIITDTNSEVQAMRGGEVDAISPTFGLNLLPLKSTPGLVFNQVPGYFQEHLDLEEGPKAQNPLLRSPWMREAIMMGIDRQAIIKTVYGPLAGNTTPLNNLLYYSTEQAYTPDFARWNFNPAKALALLKKHCTGGPSTVDPGTNAVWTCSGYPAQFRLSWTAANTTGGTQETIIQAQLKSIGIKILPDPIAANIFFSQVVSQSNYDIANLAWVTTGDASDFYETWRCGGEANFLRYCSRKSSKLMAAANGELDPAKRARDYQLADAVMAAGLPAVPLYQRPTPLIYKSDILGMVNNPSNAGPVWNIEDWHWK